MKLMKEIEVAEILNIEVGTLQNWRVLHKGPKYLKLEGAIRYRREDVEEWMERSLKDPAAGKTKKQAARETTLAAIFRPSRFGGHKTKKGS